MTDVEGIYQDACLAAMVLGVVTLAFGAQKVVGGDAAYAVAFTFMWVAVSVAYVIKKRCRDM